MQVHQLMMNRNFKWSVEFLFCFTKKEILNEIFFLVSKITDALFVTFDQAMQTGQVNNFPQFTSAIIRWIEDSCRPAVNNSIFFIKFSKFLLFRISMKLFVELLEIRNNNFVYFCIYFVNRDVVLLFFLYYPFTSFIFYRNISFMNNLWELLSEVYIKVFHKEYQMIDVLNNLNTIHLEQILNGLVEILIVMMM